MVVGASGWANIAPKIILRYPVCFWPWLYRERSLMEGFFGKLLCYRRTITRYGGSVRRSRRNRARSHQATTGSLGVHGLVVWCGFLGWAARLVL